jgi:hypothetical protein
VLMLIVFEVYIEILGVWGRMKKLDLGSFSILCQGMINSPFLQWFWRTKISYPNFSLYCLLAV